MRLTAVIRRSPPDWRKSSFCAANECVEIARMNGSVVLRSSTRPWRTVRYTPQEWQAFVNGLRAGEFRDLG
jgi:hypothetical protein